MRRGIAEMAAALALVSLLEPHGTVASNTSGTLPKPRPVKDDDRETTVTGEDAYTVRLREKNEAVRQHYRDERARRKAEAFAKRQPKARDAEKAVRS